MSDLFRIANQPVANVSAGSKAKEAGDQTPSGGNSVVAPEETAQELSRPVEAPLDQATRILESVLNNVAPGTKLRIDVDQDTGRFVYQSIDEAGEVVSQFPPEQILKFLGALREVEGLVIDTDV